MAVDSRNKRFSILNLFVQNLGHVFPNPDGAVGQADRQQFAFCYAGILFNPLIAAQFAGSVRRMTGYGT